MKDHFRIENRERFRVVGYLMMTTNQKGEGRKAAAQHWSKFKTENLETTLMDAANQEPHGLFGVNIYNTDEADPRKFRYMIAVSSSSELKEGLAEYTVPAMTWAVFPCTLETIGRTQVQAITRWLPRSKYRPLNKGYVTGKMKSGAPDIECYGKDGMAEVWIAVEEKC